MKMSLNGPFRAVSIRTLCIPFMLFLLASCGSGAEEESNGKENGSEVQDPRDSLKKKIDSLNKAIRSASQDPWLYHERADVKRGMGRISSALDDMERALQIDSTVSDFHNRKAELHFQGEMVEDAIHHYRKAIALDGDNTDALTGLADLYLATRHHQQAMDYANEALRIDQHLSRPYTVKGLIYQREGDTSRAISSLQTAVEMDTENFSVYLQLGFLTAAQDRDIAIEYYNTAHRLRPGSPRPLYNKAFYLQEQGKYDQAIDTYQELIEVDEGYVDAYYNIGYIHLVHKEQPREALEWFDKVLELTPSYHQALYNRGLCYENLEKKDSAIADYRAALEVKGNYGPAAKGLNRLDAGGRGASP